MDAHLTIFIADIAGMCAAFFIGAHLIGSRPRNTNAQLLAFMACNSICARLLARDEYSPWIAEALQFDVGSFGVALNLARNLTPGLFMIVCHRLFQERRPLPRWLLGAVVVQALSEDAIPALLGIARHQHSAFETVPALLQLTFVGYALRFIVSDWRLDLVENRRRLRLMFLFIVGSYVSTVVLLERLLIPWSSPTLFQVHVWLSVFGALLLCISLLAVMRTNVENILDPCRAPDPEPQLRASQRDAADLARLRLALSDELVYRDSTLTLGALARRLRLPEYRLRALIHERLGYRNFNALLHDYRISEISAALGDPQQQHVPILTLALSAGYNSINPFNRAFREATGVTPSAFRAHALQSAAASKPAN